MCQSVTMNGLDIEEAGEFVKALGIDPIFTAGQKVNDGWELCCLCPIDIKAMAEKAGYSTSYDPSDIPEWKLEKIKAHRMTTPTAEHLRAMMEGLWKTGVRPNERRFENEMELLKNHLDDFKRLVFEKRIKP